MTDFSRRQILINLSSVTGLGLVPFVSRSSILSESQKTKQLFVSATGADESSYGCSWTAELNHSVAELTSGFRGHSIGVNPNKNNSLVLFGRRPSRLLMRFDINKEQMIKKLECEPKRYFFGHGCFSPDGKKLFTSEASLDTGKGIIGVRDADSLVKVAEFSSNGIGPHEIKLMPDGKTLVVANGGILTHPNTGRKKLNLAFMHSNLSYLELETGNLIEEVSVSEPKASIRHIDVSTDGTVALAIQMQRQVSGHNRVVSLAGSHKQKNDILLFDGPENLIIKMNDYVGSVAINSTNRVAGFTSPKGNLVAFWHIDRGSFVGYHRLQDVCGICVTGDASEFVISNSNGQLRFINATTLKEVEEKRLTFSNTRWDNHLTSLTLDL